MSTRTIYFFFVSLLVALILMMAAPAVEAAGRSSFGPFAPDGSLTVERASNTNLVAPGFKGAYGGHGILLPEDPADTSVNDDDSGGETTVNPPSNNPPVNPPVNPPPSKPPKDPKPERPGHGYGDKNHDHSGPPGKDK